MNIIDIFQNLFSGSGFNDYQPYKTMPTFIFPLKDDLFEHTFSIANELYTGVKENISEFNSMMQKSLGNPWDLATMQINSAAKNRSNNNFENEFEYNAEHLNDYYNLVFNKQNSDAHLKSLPLAWQGAIKHGPGALCKMDLETLLKELIYSGCTLIAGKID